MIFVYLHTVDHTRRWRGSSRFVLRLYSIYLSFGIVALFVFIPSVAVPRVLLTLMTTKSSVHFQFNGALIRPYNILEPQYQPQALLR